MKRRWCYILEMAKWKSVKSAGEEHLAQECQKLEEEGYEVKFVIPLRQPAGAEPGTQAERGIGVYYILGREMRQYEV